MAGHGVALPSGTDCSDLAGPWVGAGNRPRCCHPPSIQESPLSSCAEIAQRLLCPLGKERQGSGAGWAPDPAASANRRWMSSHLVEDRREVRGQSHRAPLFQNNRREEERGRESAEKTVAFSTCWWGEELCTSLGMMQEVVQMSCVQTSAAVVLPSTLEGELSFHLGTPCSLHVIEPSVGARFIPCSPGNCFSAIIITVHI